MTRKELYKQIKELNVANFIKEKFGDNYTRIPNRLLEQFLQDQANKNVVSVQLMIKDKSTREVVTELLNNLRLNLVISNKEG